MAGLVAFAVLLTLLNLLLIFAVIRRLREHTEQLASLAAGHGSDQNAGLPVGRRVADFSGTTVDGEAISRDLLTGETLVAFLMPGCTPCRKSLPELAETVANWPGGRASTLVVISGDEEKAAEYVATLAPVARVLVEGPDGQVGTAFEAAAYPLFGTVDSHGRVLRSERDPGVLSVVTPV
ncbi:redoxin domain-containing protein [Kribbella sp. NPDC056861]|uniref:TlpA family protein disulfide reductase n=1 Tax=Kribbella sp. NPDC056861 TaxID=3154857 RepID=UPI003426DF3B